MTCVCDDTTNALYWIVGGREEDPSSFSSFSFSSSSSFRCYCSSSWKKDVSDILCVIIGTR